jgi:hypothetical protein
MYYGKLCRGGNFPISPQRKQKLKIKAIRTTNSAGLMKSKLIVASMYEI